jgi:hypothetical protein
MWKVGLKEVAPRITARLRRSIHLEHLFFMGTEPLMVTQQLRRTLRFAVLIPLGKMFGLCKATNRYLPCILRYSMRDGLGGVTESRKEWLGLAFAR